MLNFYAPMNHLGYGVHSFNLLKALDKQGIDIALFPPSNKVDLKEPMIEKWLKNQSLFKCNDPGVMLFHEQYMNRFHGKPRIGFPVFEVGINDADYEKLKSLDYIIQTSEWFKLYLEGGGFKNVTVIPEGYDETVYNMNSFDIKKKIELLNKEGLIFSHIGKFEERKNSRNILKVFTYALDGHNTRCTLIAHMFNLFNPNWLTTIQNYVNALGYVVCKENEDVVTFAKNNLRIMVPKLPMKDIREIYNNSHFGLYLFRAEGWNLPLMESIACGVPCITPDWTGPSEYIKEGYPLDFVITSCAKVPAFDNEWFFGDKGFWFDADLSQAKKALRIISGSPEKYLQLAKDCAKSISEFTWTNAALKFAEFGKSIGIITKEKK